MKLLVNTDGGIGGFGCIADLDVIVVPTQFLVPLQAGKEFGFGDEITYTGDCTSR
jgi:hypothetical protein